MREIGAKLSRELMLAVTFAILEYVCTRARNAFRNDYKFGAVRSQLGYPMRHRSSHDNVVFFFSFREFETTSFTRVHA